MENVDKTVMKDWPISCARKLASSVLLLAVNDLSSKSQALPARAWLESQECEMFLDVLNLDPDAFRQVLNRTMQNKGSGGKGFQMILDL